MKKERISTLNNKPSTWHNLLSTRERLCSCRNKNSTSSLTELTNTTAAPHKRFTPTPKLPVFRALDCPRHYLLVHPQIPHRVVLYYITDNTNRIMWVTYSQETCTRILHKSTCTRNLHVCRGFLYKFFLVQISCTEYNAALLRARNLCARDQNWQAWLVGCTMLISTKSLFHEVCY